MKWLELSVQVPSEFVEPVSYLFGRYGRAFSIEDVGTGQLLLRTYLTSNSRRRRAAIEVGVKLIGALRPIEELEVREVEQRDWEETWKNHFALLRVGRSLVIKPSWIAYQPQDGDRVVELDPGLAFGTGHHPTTLMCLELLEELLRPGMRLLDLGTGSGILTIATARLGAGSMVALDLDPLAVKVARKNLRANGLRGKVSLAYGNLPHPLALEASFDLAVVNIGPKVIKECAPHLRQCLKAGGKLIASGFLQEQEHEVRDSLGEIGLPCKGRRSIEDWVSLVFSRIE